MTRIAALARGSLEAAQALLEQSCAWDDLTDLAEEVLFATSAKSSSTCPLGAFEGEQLVGLACTSGAWIRIIAVIPKARSQGIGSMLLRACENQIGEHASAVRLLDEPGNYLSPGIDTRNHEAIEWLERRGYRATGSACNLLIRLEHNASVSTARLEALQTRCTLAGYQIARLPNERLDEVAALVSTSFSDGWAFELRRAHTVSCGVHIATEKATGRFAGFAAHDGNNARRGWFGPTGTLESDRGQGLGAALLMACLLDIRAAGHSHCQVAWIGPRAFYDKIAGIDSERHFTTMRKELS